MFGLSEGPATRPSRRRERQIRAPALGTNSGRRLGLLKVRQCLCSTSHRRGRVCGTSCSCTFLASPTRVARREGAAAPGAISGCDFLILRCLLRTAAAAAGSPRPSVLQQAGTSDNSTSTSTSSRSSVRGRREGTVTGSQPRHPDGPTSGSSPPFPAVARRETEEPNHADNDDVAMDDAQRPDQVTARPSRIEHSDDNESCSATQSLESSNTNTSDLSTFLASATAPREAGREGGRRRSVVVRDWKAGQREAFSELDRRASASGGGIGVGVGGSGGGGS